MLKKIILSALIILSSAISSFATISSVNSRMDYTGNGSVDTYAYNYKIFANTDLLVTVRNTSDVETTLTLTTDYTVTGVGASGGGNLVLVNSGQAWLDADGDLKSNYILTIRRVRPLKQLTDIRNQGVFYPEIHENAFDSLTMMAQQQQDEIDRSIKLPETVDPDDFDTNMPADIVGNPGVSIIVNSDGDGFTTGPDSDAISAAQANATAAAASASAASSSASSASSSASAAAASAASVNLPSIASNSLNILQVNSGATAYQFMDLRAPNVGIGTATPAAGKFTTLEATSTFKVGTTNQGDILYDNGTSLVRLTPGTSGQYLKTQGAAANPLWATAVPQGVIVMWSGTIATIPAGWELSDGTCSITCPDLRNRFIVAADADDSGAAKTTISGAATQSGGSTTIDITQIPAHTHSIETNVSGSAFGSVVIANSNAAGDTSRTTGSAGSGQPYLQPYYALAYIIKS